MHATWVMPIRTSRHATNTHLRFDMKDLLLLRLLNVTHPAIEEGDLEIPVDEDLL
jgi:hypothetical protein